MKLKTIFTSISANLDSVVSKIENHEALADCAISDARQATAKIRGQLSLTQRRLQNLKRDEQDLQNQCSTWKRRAKNCEDRTKALNCVRSLQRCENSLKHVSQQILETEGLQADLSKTLTEAEDRLGEIQSRKTALAARSARNQVLATANKSHSSGKIDDVFERWENSVVADEYMDQITLPDADRNYDALDAEFSEKEQEDALSKRLNDLLTND